MSINVAMIVSTLMVLQCLAVLGWAATHVAVLSGMAAIVDFMVSFYLVGILLPEEKE